MRLLCLASTLLALALPFGLASPSPAQTSSSSSPQDTAAINAVVSSLTEAWNRGDSRAFAARYAADGSFTNIRGTTLFGHDPFQKQHEAIFTTIYKGSTVSFTIDRIHFIRPDVAIADITGKLSGVAHFPPGIQPGSDGVLLTRLQLVLTRESGAWWIASFHNVAVLPSPPQP